MLLRVNWNDSQLYILRTRPKMVLLPIVQSTRPCWLVLLRSYTTDLANFQFFFLFHFQFFFCSAATNWMMRRANSQQVDARTSDERLACVIESHPINSKFAFTLCQLVSAELAYIDSVAIGVILAQCRHCWRTFIDRRRHLAIWQTLDAVCVLLFKFYSTAPPGLTAKNSTRRR